MENKNTTPEKTAQDRLKEIEKLKVETDRANAVATAKLSHASIENIEKNRKKPFVMSLFWRIKDNQQNIETLLKYFEKTFESSNDPLLQIEKDMIRNITETYKSIREDFKEVLEIKHERFNILFPEKTTCFENRIQALSIIIGIGEQQSQLKAYLTRKIF
ncbi:MAG: hypothetical protein KKB25_01610 [Nanoarchaeota archaeon]|nr:hypothetical protein [Nanoarchaeota archaeon]